MDCSEVDELAGAIALRALPAEVQRAVAEHLATCERHNSELLALSRVVSLLPFAVEEVEPPARLKANLLAAALADEHRDATRPAAAGAAAGREAPHLGAVPPAEQRRAATGEPLPLQRPAAARTRRFWQQPGIWAAAAALLIAVGLGAWNVSLQRRLSDRDATSARQARALTALASAVRVVPLSGSGGMQAAFAAAPDGTGSLVLAGARPAPPGKVYQAWFIRAGQPVSAGVFNDDGVAVVPLQGSAAGAQMVAVTVEPPGGSLQPTSQPIAAGTIGS